MHFNFFVTIVLLKEKLTDDKITFVNISFGGAKMRKKIISLILTAIVIIMTFCACGQKDGTGKALSYPVSGEPACLDPQIATGDAALTTVYNTMLSLVKIDSSNNIVPGAAASWDISGNDCVYTFHLKDGLKWHILDTTEEIAGSDFSGALTSYDFAFGITRTLLPETQSPFAKDFYIIKNGEKVNAGELSEDKLGIETPDSQTIRITLEEPSDEFLYLMATSGAMPCNEDFFNGTKGRYGLDVDYYLSCGPFYLSKWNHDSSIVLRKNYNTEDKLNKDYAVFKDVKPSSITLYIQTGEDTIAEEVNDDKLSAAWVSSLTIDEFSDKDQSVTYYAAETWGFLINGGYSYALSSTDLRKAFMLAMSPLSVELEENEKAAGGVIPDACLLGGKSYREAAGNISLPSTNTAYAKQLWDSELTRLGMKTLDVTVTCTEKDEANVRRIIGQWQEVFGISFSAKINVVPIEDVMSTINSGGYQIAFAPIAASTSRTDDILKMFISGYGVYSENYNKLSQQALSAESDSKIELTKKCEEFLVQNYYVYPVVSRNKAFALSPNCSGITYSSYLGVPIFEAGERYD